MDKNVVRTVVETLTTGCSNTAGGDCHWRREYLRLKERFAEYRKATERELMKLVATESKLKDYKDRVANVMQKADREQELLRTKILEVEEKEDEIFLRGVEHGKDVFRDSVEYNKNMRSCAEADFLNAQGKIMLMEKENEQAAADFKKRIVELEEANMDLKKRNQSLIKDIEVIKKEADAVVDTYRTIKRKAVDDYTKLKDVTDSLHVAYLTQGNKCEETERRNERLVAKCKELDAENYYWKSKESELRMQYERNLQAARESAVAWQREAQKAFNEQCSSAQFAGINHELDNKMKVILNVLEENSYNNQKLKGTAAQLKRTMRSILQDVLNTLKTLSQELEQAVSKKAHVEEELESVAHSLKTLNQGVYEYLKSTRMVLQDLSKATGTSMLAPNFAEVEAFVTSQNITREGCEDQGSGGQPGFLYLLHQEMLSFTELLKGLKEWTTAINSNVARLSDRKVQLQNQLEEEKLMRFKEKEISTEKLKIYKILVIKLRGRLEQLTKSLESKFNPPSRFFQHQQEIDTKEQANLHADVSSHLRNYEEFRVMLERAEGILEKIEASPCDDNQKQVFQSGSYQITSV